MRKRSEPEGERGAGAGINRTVGSVLRMSGDGIALRSLLRDKRRDALTPEGATK